MKSKLFLFTLLGAFASGCSRNMVDWSVISEGEIDNWGQTPYDENIILLQHKEDESRSPFLNGRPLRQAAQVSSLGIQAIHVPEHMTALELIAQLRSTDEYTFVEPNFLPSLPSVTYRPMSTHQIASGNSAIAFNDPYESYQWHMDQIQADEVSSSYWGEDIIVAVIDTGVSEGPDGFHSLIGGYDFINSDNDPSDDHGHGTHVAGTVAQQTDNGIGVRGVAPFASIMPLKSLDEDGIGSTLATTQAIEYAVDNGAHVINLSLVSEVSSTPERNAVVYAQEAGVAVIAAAGNDGRTMNGVGYPAAYPESIAVSAVGYNERLTDYSNAGPEIDFAAPGGDVDVDRNGDTYADGVLQETIIDGSFNYYFFEGTSMATPHVAGVYAVLMGAGASAEEATEALQFTTTDLGSTGNDTRYGDGLVQLNDALNYFLSADPPTSDPVCFTEYEECLEVDFYEPLCDLYYKECIGETVSGEMWCSALQESCIEEDNPLLDCGQFYEDCLDEL